MGRGRQPVLVWKYAGGLEPSTRFEHAGQMYTIATEAEVGRHPAAPLSNQRPGGLVLAYCEGKERVPVSFVPDHRVRVEAT